MPTVLDTMVFLTSNNLDWLTLSLEDYLNEFEIEDENIPDTFFGFVFDMKVKVQLIKVSGDTVKFSTKEYSEMNTKTRGLFCNIMDFLEALDPELEINNPFENGY